MHYFAYVMQCGLLVWFALLSALIATRMLRGDINVSGMLANRRAGGPMTPERVVSMAVFPTFIIGYAVVGLRTDVTGLPPSLPDIPSEILNLLIGSNGLYLAGKIARS
jgi:hypothetical protein